MLSQVIALRGRGLVRSSRAGSPVNRAVPIVVGNEYRQDDGAGLTVPPELDAHPIPPSSSTPCCANRAYQAGWGGPQWREWRQCLAVAEDHRPDRL